MKKILFIFSFSLLVFHSKGQSYQYYQWQGFEPGIFCNDTMSLECDVEHFAVDTGRNTLWIIGDFNGADTTHSPGIVGYKNNEFVKFPGLTDSSQIGYDYFVYNGQLVGCNQYSVWIYNMDSPQITVIGTFPTSIYSGGVCLAEYNGDLYVGGQFTAIKGPTGGWVTSWSIARWDGTQWNPLGTGLVGYPVVNDMVAYQNKLIAAGLFQTAGGIDAWNIASWDGSNWDNLWSGTGGYGTNNNSNTQAARVRDLELFQNNLYIIGDIDSVCGIPTHLAYWNGVNWTGTSYPLHAKLFKSFLNHLIVFTNENALQIDWWENNQIIPVDSMFDQTYIGALETFNDTLFVSGGFMSSGSTPLFRLARLVYDSTNVGTGKVLNNTMDEISIYPIPADEKVFISDKQNNNSASVQIFNYTGQLVYENKNFKDEAIDTKQLSNGIYLLRYSTDNYFSSVKFIVQH